MEGKWKKAYTKTENLISGKLLKVGHLFLWLRKL